MREKCSSCTNRRPASNSGASIRSNIKNGRRARARREKGVPVTAGRKETAPKTVAAGKNTLTENSTSYTTVCTPPNQRRHGNVLSRTPSSTDTGYASSASATGYFSLGSRSRSTVRSKSTRCTARDIRRLANGTIRRYAGKRPDGDNGRNVVRNSIYS